ncbi:U1 zinc finger protein [Diplocarpon rosae]|nr:U1 zinc finger protein [Diplocarpon rosae]
MSEYWKSTPKYWCKHCKTYVRDTKLEKANHEATPKHQGNLKRFLRDLHREHEKDEKEKQRSKAEVERLKGLVAGGGSASTASSSSSSFGRGPAQSTPKPQATEAQRKKQLAQLLELGVTLPDEFRSEMAMPGEWQVTSERVIELEGTERKPETLALGVRKREVIEEEEELTEAKKRRWGSTYRTHPTEEDFDLDALLNEATRKGKEPETEMDAKDEAKLDLSLPASSTLREEFIAQGHKPETVELGVPAGIKREPSDGEAKVVDSLPPMGSVKQEGGEQSGSGIVFKKRKAKNIRQK